MKRKLNWLDRIMMAVTFAEENCPETAKELMAGSKSAPRKAENAQGSMLEGPCLPRAEAGVGN